jgi:arylformamidase
MTTTNHPAVGRIGPYRAVHLSKILDPATETRRCAIRRHEAPVLGVTDYHSEIDIMSHLGTHVEAPCHHGALTKDVTALPFTHYMGRGVLLRLDTCGPRALITRADLEAAAGGRIRPGDVLVLDSPYHSEPFVVSNADGRPQLSREAAEWFVERQVKAVGFGDGIAIENNPEHCVACHDLMLGNDILFIEVMRNIGQLRDDVFLVIFQPLPIRGLDSSPVNVVALEGVPGFATEVNPK